VLLVLDAAVPLDWIDPSPLDTLYGPEGGASRLDSCAGWWDGNAKAIAVNENAARSQRADGMAMME